MEENEVLQIDVPPVDLTEVTEQIQLLSKTLTETLTEEKTVKVDNEEMTSEQVLVEILQTLQPSEEDLQQQELEKVEQAEQEELEQQLLEEEQEFKDSLLESVEALNENVALFNENSETILEHQSNEMVLYSMEYYSAMCIIIFACLIPLFWIVKQFKTMINWFT